jgi:hypothetical protein
MAKGRIERISEDALGKILNSLRDYHTRRNFTALLNAVRSLESREVTKGNLAYAFSLVCDLGWSLRKIAEVADYAFKWVKIEGLFPERIKALSFLAQAIIPPERLDGGKLGSIKGKISEFIKGLDFKTITIEERQLWLAIIHNLFQDKFIALQLALSQEVFDKTPTRAVKAQAVTIHTLSARRMKRGFEDGTVDVQKIREMAEFLLDKAPSHISDKELWDDEIFHSFIVDLGCIELFDLQERALAIRRPAPEDPIWVYMRLTKKLRENPDQAYAELKALPPFSEGSYNPTILGELQVLQVQIIRAYLEHNKKSAAECTPPQLKSFLREVLCSPRSDYPEIMNKIRKLRAAIFAGIQDKIKRRTYSCSDSNFSEYGGFLRELVGDRAFTVCVPEADAVESYLLDAGDNRYFKARFRITKGQASPQAIFEGVNEEEQGKISLFWDFMTLIACKAYIQSEELMARVQQGIQEIIEEMMKEADSLSIQQNRRIFEGLQSAFLENPDYQTLQVELDNRCLLCRKMIEAERLIADTMKIEAALEPQDFLYGLIEKVKIVGPAELKHYLSIHPLIRDKLAGSSAGFPLGIYMFAKDGAIMVAFLKGPDNLVVPGSESSRPDGLFINFLRELVLETVVRAKLRAAVVDTKKKDTRPTGYLVEGEESVGRAGEGSELQQIYRAVFYKQLREKGLLRFSWYYLDRVDKDEVLFKPLENQSPRAKKEAIKKMGAGNLFVQVEPSGFIQRLPVRRVKVGGKLTVAPWKRNPVREEQQALLGDTRPLPQYHGLYVATTFSDGSKHLRLYALRSTEDDILADELLGKVEREVREGKFRDPKLLFKGTSKEVRGRIEPRLARGEISIESQEVEVFSPIQTTFHRPKMASVASLLQEGFVLE